MSGQEMGVVLRQLTKSDSSEAAFAHVEAFPGFFLTSLGLKFLNRFYFAYASHPNSICIGAFRLADGKLCGFVYGTTNGQGLFSWMRRRHGWRLLYHALPSVLSAPGATLMRIARSLVFSGDPPGLTQADVLLSSIAVSKTGGNAGLGTLLLDAFLLEAKARGGKVVFLTTDARDNEYVNRFYVRKGFVVESTFKRKDGRLMNRYCLDIYGSN
jgi:ribosomal protein S18 acetylase RimI-like enzyme